jgi:hypothetical protein
VFDIIAADDDKLALPVEVEGVDDAKPRQPRPGVSRRLQPPPESEADDDGRESQNEQQSDRGGDEHQTLILENLVN